ncbi:MAG: glycosyltransferase family 4 protein [Anaerolineales bacterium]|nr:glycosyltransferase family 4 protein [Anaerolineales bacterium]
MKRQVLIVGNFLSQKRTTRGVCEDLAEKLSTNGWSVITTSSRESRLLRLLTMVGTVWWHRRRYSVAQVDVYSGPSFIWAEIVVWILKRLRKPYILTLHGGNLPIFADQNKGRARKLLEPAAFVTTPSRYLLEGMQVYRADIQLLPNPLDVTQYHSTQQQNLGPKLIWLRAFHDIYNPDLAIKVVAQLASDFPNISLIMVGPDKGDGSLQRCQQLASELGVIEHIQFVGGVPKTEVPKWLAQGNCFINTTNVDNTPVSVLEAMATGLCVVSTNVGGIPYILDDGINALLVPPDDSVAMSDAIGRILRDQALAYRLSTKALETALNCDWSVILPQWEALLTSAITGKSNQIIE